MSIYTINQLSSVLGFKPGYLLDLDSRSQDCYRPYPKKKDNKKTRIIDNPNDELKKVQKSIDKNILSLASKRLPKYMYGARSGMSMADCAKVHVGRPALLSMDLSQCYSSISAARVYIFFRKKLRFSRKIATLLTDLTTFEGHLPQGSPASPSLCNLILEPIVRNLKGLSDKSSTVMSHFMDDFFFSGDLESLCKIKRMAIKIIQNNGFTVNDKTKIRKRSQPMLVGNIVVNKKLSIEGSTKRKVEKEILTLTKKDLNDYERVSKDMKAAQREGRKSPRSKTKISIIRGQISNIMSIDHHQGIRLKNKLSKKISDLKRS